MSILAKVVQILIAVCFLVLAYYLVIWVLGMLGIDVPAHILKVIFVLLGLMALYGVLTGSVYTWWRGTP